MQDPITPQTWTDIETASPAPNEIMRQCYRQTISQAWKRTLEVLLLNAMAMGTSGNVPNFHIGIHGGNPSELISHQYTLGVITKI